VAPRVIAAGIGKEAAGQASGSNPNPPLRRTAVQGQQLPFPMR